MLRQKVYTMGASAGPPMIFLPLSSGFYIILATSLVLGAISNNWFSLWASLELNMVAFLPLLTASGSLLQLENSVKYFLTQAVASLWFFLSLALSAVLGVAGAALLATGAMVVKLGLAPCQAWFFSVMATSSWGGLFLLSTSQKVLPLLVLGRIAGSSWVLVTVILLTAAVVSVGGMGQMSARKVLTYSSINNVSWMVASMGASGYAWSVYFSSYTMMMIPIVGLFSTGGSGFRSHLASPGSERQGAFLILVSLFSLGGLPPLLGFFNKLLVAKLLLMTAAVTVLMAIIFSSLVLLYFYTGLAFYVLSVSPRAGGPCKGARSGAVKALVSLPILGVFVMCSLAGN